MSEDVQMPRPCFICSKDLMTEGSNTDPGAEPMGALTFRAVGHAQSNAFGKQRSPRWLQIYVCDDCLREDPSSVVMVTPVNPPQMAEEFQPEAATV